MHFRQTLHAVLGCADFVSCVLRFPKLALENESKARLILNYQNPAAFSRRLMGHGRLPLKGFQKGRNSASVL